MSAKQALPKGPSIGRFTMNTTARTHINFSALVLPLVGLLFIVVAAMGAVFTAEDASAATGEQVESAAVQVATPLMSLNVSGGGGNR